MAEQKNFVYIGKWAMTGGRDSSPAPAMGFGIYEYDIETGMISHIKDVFQDIAVGFTYIDKRRNVLYCTNEIAKLPGYAEGGGGRVFAFALDTVTGDMTQISCKPSFAPLPCGCCVDSNSEFLLVTNHSGGSAVTKAVKDIDGKYHISLEYDDASVVMYPINENGSLDDPCDIYKLEGLPSQGRPHPHSVSAAPDGSCYIVCDKGVDRIWTFKIDRTEKKLVLCGTEGYRTAPKSSPRYGCFHPEKPYFFANNESVPYVCSYKYNEYGALTEICSASIVPDGYDIDNPPPELSHPKHRPEQSDIRLHPNGKYLYDIVRGLDLLVVFEVNGDTGELVRKQIVEIKPGEIPQLAMHGPRGMAISPDGKFLLLASGGTNELITWKIGDDGLLTRVNVQQVSEKPANVAFL